MDVACDVDELAGLLVLSVPRLRDAEVSEEVTWGVDVAPGRLLLVSMVIFCVFLGGVTSVGLDDRAFLLATLRAFLPLF